MLARSGLTFRQINPDSLVKTLHDHPNEPGKRSVHTRGSVSHCTPYSSRYSSGEEIPKFVIPRTSTPADAVAQMLRDELDLDGKPNLNLAR